jgi:hypothetical protein
VGLENGWSEDWLIVRLAARANIDRVVVRSTPDCVTQEFKVLVSDGDASSDPIAGSAPWVEVAHVRPDAAAPDKELAFDSTIATFIAVEFLSTDCEAWGGWASFGDHEIREIEAWTAPLATPPDGGVAAPSCLSGAM